MATSSHRSTSPPAFAWAALAWGALLWPAVTGAAQSDAWVVDVRVTTGSLGADAARPVIEGARRGIASCTDGPGPHRFDYTLSLRPNGQVREAAYDRGATSDPRAARCIRHELLELHFPAHADAAALALTLRAGEFEPSPPSTSTPPPVTPPSSPIGTPGPRPIPTPMPSPGPTDAPAATSDVAIGAVSGATGRTGEQVLSVIAPQRSALTGCLGTAHATDPALAGDATLHLTVSPEGRVTNAMFQAPEALASALSSCVAQAARTWVFGATGAESRISIPLTFGGASRPVRR